MGKRGHKSPSFTVFISYSGEDAELARRLADSLREAGYDPLYAGELVSPGENWALKIGRAIEQADVIVALLSPSTMRSEWPRHELEFALTSAKHAGRVIPVLTPGTDPKTVPWIIRHVDHVRSGPDWRKTTQEVIGRMRALAGAA